MAKLKNNEVKYMGTHAHTLNLMVCTYCSGTEINKPAQVMVAGWYITRIFIRFRLTNAYSMGRTRFALLASNFKLRLYTCTSMKTFFLNCKELFGSVFM